MIKGSLYQGDITRVSIFEPNIGTPKFIMLLSEGRNSNTIIVGDFRPHFFTMEESSTQRINKENWTEKTH